MADIAQLIETLQTQHKQQMKVLQDQNDKLVEALSKSTANGSTTAGAIPDFSSFDPTAELWSDYWERFKTFLDVHSIPETKHAQVFLTNQSTVTYKLLSSYATQMSPPKAINSLDIEEITTYMKEQFDPTRYIVRERYKFWSNLTRKPGETIHELAARIRQDAVTCDFTSIKDPQDEALRTRFICSVNNEAVLKALFKVKDEELTFAKAVTIANETEDAARVAKETVYGSKQSSVNKLAEKQKQSTSKTHNRSKVTPNKHTDTSHF